MKNSEITKNTTVIIPAAGFIKSACNYCLSVQDPGFLNIGTSLAINEIQKKVNSKIILGVKKSNKNIYNLNPFNSLKIIEIGDTPNIIETIKKFLNIIDTDWCLINPITSIPTEVKLSNSFIEFGKHKIPRENWSSITLDDENNPKFHNKSDSSSLGINSYPFTGRIFAKTTDILSQINKLDESENNDLLYLAERLFQNKNSKIKFSEWLDIGHIATYPSTKLSSINSRFFNNLIYDKDRNSIKKISFKKSKIEQEINFYKNLSNDLRRFFPTIISVENNKNFSSYEMSFIGKPNLAEIFLFSKIGPNSIIRIFKSINLIYKEFYEKPPLTIENTKWLYSSKAIARKAELRNLINQNKIIKKLYYQEFSVNNIKLPSLQKSFSLLLKKLSSLENSRPLHVGHGDLCFNNILVDPVFGHLHLIDPKAEKHKVLKIYGLVDSYYDLSKLNHSIEGLYDSIVNNLFSLKILGDNQFNLEIYKPEEYELYKKSFSEIVINNRISTENLEMLTGNLFLTMLPLHKDNELRILVFALIGSIFINRISIKNFFA